jgi:hypothetical protein
MCSNVGVPMVAACGFVALGHRKPRIAAAAVLPPLLASLVWYAAIGHLNSAYAAPSLHAFTPVRLASYVWTGLTASVGGFIHASQSVGGVLISLLAGAAVVRRNVPAALAATSVVFYAFVGVGR